MRKAYAGLWGCCGVISMAPAVHADLLFHDNFESASSVSPYTWAEQNSDAALRTDSDPDGASPGSWFTYSKTVFPEFFIQVTNSTATPPGGAAEGQNYLRIHREAVNQPGFFDQASIAATFAPQIGGTVTATWRMYIPDRGNDFFQFGTYFTEFIDNTHNQGLNGARTTVFCRGDGTMRLLLNNSSSTQNFDTPAATTNTWQQWKLETNLDTQQSILTVDGVSSGSLAFNVAGNTAAGLVFFGAQSTAEFYIDDLAINNSSAGPKWAANADGNWSNAANWQGAVPNAVGAVANFTDAITAPRTVTVDSPQSVGTIYFSNANRYTIAGTSTLTVDVTSGAGTAGIVADQGSHTISAPMTFNRPTVIRVAQPSSTLTLSGDIASSSQVISKFGLGLLEMKTVRAARLSINEGTVRVISAGTDAATSRVGTLTMGGATDAWTAQLDLANNDLVIDYTSPSPFATQLNRVKTGYNSGAWNGNGIISSTAAAAPGTGLGIAEASAVFGSGGGTFSGQAVDDTAVLIKYTYYGDTNLDGQVDVIDLGNLATAWQTAGSWVNGDSNYDGTIDVIDLGLLATNWQAGVGSPLGPGSLDQALSAYGLPSVAVPEPGGVLLGISILGGAVALPRRRR